MKGGETQKYTPGNCSLLLQAITPRNLPRPDKNSWLDTLRKKVTKRTAANSTMNTVQGSQWPCSAPLNPELWGRNGRNSHGGNCLPHEGAHSSSRGALGLSSGWGCLASRAMAVHSHCDGFVKPPGPPELLQPQQPQVRFWQGENNVSCLNISSLLPCCRCHRLRELLQQRARQAQQQPHPVLRDDEEVRAKGHSQNGHFSTPTKHHRESYHCLHWSKRQLGISKCDLREKGKVLKWSQCNFAMP